MRKILSAAASLTLLFGTLAPSIASAAQENKQPAANAKTTVSQSTTDTTKTEDSTAPTPTTSDDTTASSADRTKRIDVYKKNLTEKLTTAQQKKVEFCMQELSRQSDKL